MLEQHYGRVVPIKDLEKIVKLAEKAGGSLLQEYVYVGKYMKENIKHTVLAGASL